MRTAFIDQLTQIARKDTRTCLLTGDLGFSVVEKFAAAFPDRFFNVGVAEANMMGLATGLALDGWIPYVYSIGTFASMRAYEQMRNGPVLHRLPVRVIGIGGGFAYGHAGPTHFSLEDLAILRAQPGLTVVAPSDPRQTTRALEETHALPGPVYYRLGKGGDPEIPGLDGRFALDQVESLGAGKGALVLTTGSMAVEVMAAVQDIPEATVGIVPVLNPAPAASLLQLAKDFDRILSVEEHYRQGGLGSLAAEVLSGAGRNVRFRTLAIDKAPQGLSGSRAYLLGQCGLDRRSIAHALRSLLQEPKP